MATGFAVADNPQPKVVVIGMMDEFERLCLTGTLEVCFDLGKAKVINVNKKLKL